MADPYRWGGKAPEAVTRIKERRAHRARLARLRQAIGDIGMPALGFAEVDASVPEHLQAMLHLLREIACQLKPVTSSWSFE